MTPTKAGVVAGWAPGIWLPAAEKLGKTDRFLDRTNVPTAANPGQRVVIPQDQKQIVLNWITAVKHPAKPGSPPATMRNVLEPAGGVP